MSGSGDHLISQNGLIQPSAEPSPEETAEHLRVALADRYDVIRPIGAGGMATVYLAVDRKLDREVAVKVLRQDLAALLGPERFVREVEIAAKLNHPHILTLIDFGSANGLLYYVMPYVSGESLQHRLSREKQLAIGEAVRITQEVASALDYAHRQGVIHRDIKPANILLHDDHAVVADFGIALAVQTAGGSRLTETGLSLGTPHYMSPEQATADRGLDGRSDIYSLGCVLYELLVGDPPHTGPTAQAIIAKVITSEPVPITEHRKAVPPHVSNAVHTALQKLPADRFATASTFAEALTVAHAEDLSVTTGSTVAAPQLARSRVSLRWAVIFLGIGMAVGFTVGTMSWRGAAMSAPPSGFARMPLRLPPDQPAGQFGDGNLVAISRDGRRFAYSGAAPGGEWLFVREMNRERADAVPGSQGMGRPFFSPDGEWLGVVGVQDGRMYKVAVDGGTPLLITERVVRSDMSWFSVASWGRNDSILFMDDSSGLSLIASSGGPVRSITKPELDVGEVRHTAPQILPDGQKALFITLFERTAGIPPRLSAVDLLTGETSAVSDSVTWAHYAPTGHLFSKAAGAGASVLSAVPFDVEGLAPTGPARTILERVGGYGRALADNGTLVFFEPVTTPPGTLVRFGETTMTSVTADERVYRTPRVSPGGTHIAVEVHDPERRAWTRPQIWIFELATGRSFALTDEGANIRPVWTPDGTAVVFASNRSASWPSAEDPGWDLYRRRADGSGPTELLLAEEEALYPTSAANDGSIGFVRGRPFGEGVEFSVLPTDGSSTNLLDHVRYVVTPLLSPDGRKIVYLDVEGRATGDRLYVEFLGAASSRRALEGGGTPAWSSDGATLFYRSGEGLVSVDVHDSTVVLESRRVEPAWGEQRGVSFYTEWGWTQYDVFPDGRTFVAVANTPTATTATGGVLPRLQVAFNLFELLHEVGKP